MDFFAATAANIQDITADEAKQSGATKVKTVPGGVEFSGTLETAYHFSLWSRTASRLLLLLGTGEGIESGDQLYRKAMTIRWFDHIDPNTSFAVNATVRNCRWLNNSQFGVFRVKDAIADQMREIHDSRPSVDTENPDIAFHLHLNGTHGLFYIDLTGKSLHRRGYRKSSTPVTLKEQIAAAFIIRSGWEPKASGSATLLDPFCGSGTIPIEAALMASDTAPGLLHPGSYAFLSWKGHDAKLWAKLLSDAKKRQAAALDQLTKAAEAGNKLSIIGWDIDERAVQSAASHAVNAGMEALISFDTRDFTKEKSNSAPGAEPGFLVSDMPYGARSAERDSRGGLYRLQKLYQETGSVISEYYPGWNISLLCGTPDLLKEVGMKPRHSNTLFNGAIQCVAAHYTVFSLEEREELRIKAEERRRERETRPLTQGGEMIASRLRKNRRMLKAFLKRTGITSYRLYDADMPEYSAAIDIYEGRWVHLQEYAAPDTIDPAAATQRLNDMVDAVNRVTEIPYEQIYIKQRRRQTGKDQYSRRKKTGEMNIAREHGLRFYVNFTDYIDTGIFLDHRPVRKMIMEMSEGKRFLNLFGYTGTATVHAAAGGALSTMTVDASKRYLQWAEKNMDDNGFSGMNHQYYAADCIEWLNSNHHRFDLIFMDPPTFSNSKSRRESFDIQRDHENLIFSVMRHLEYGGTLIFSNNFRRFDMSLNIIAKFKVENITEASIPEDFARNRKIHNCWLIRHRIDEKGKKQAGDERKEPEQKKVPSTTSRTKKKITRTTAGNKVGTASTIPANRKKPVNGQGHENGTSRPYPKPVAGKKGSKRKVVVKKADDDGLTLDF